MTATPAAQPDPPAVTPVEAFTTTKKNKTTVVTLDGHPLTVHRPKTSWFLDKAASFGAAADGDPRQIELVHETIEKVFQDEADQAYLYGRLRDEADDFDYEDVDLMLVALKEKWAGGRPTGPPTGPSDRRQKTGGRSTARRR